MINKIVRFLYYSLFFLTSLIMFPYTSELFEFNKMLFIYSIATLVGFFLAVEFILSKKNPLPKTFFNWVIAFFISTLLASTLFSIDRHTSLFGYYGRFNGGVFSIIAYIILFYGFVSHFNTQKNQERVLKTSLISSFLVILWGLPGKFGYDLSCYLFTQHLNNNCWSDQFRPQDRMFSTLGQPNWLGAYLAINFFIGLYFYISQKADNKSHRLGVISWLYGGYLLINFTSILFTRSRSALMSWGIGMILFSVLITWFNMKIKTRLASFSKKLVVLGIVCFLSILIFRTGADKIDRFIPFQPKTSQQQVTKAPQLSSEVTESLDIRKIVWKGAIQLGLNYPLFGTGPETFAYSYYQTRPVEHNMTSEWDFIYNKAHNEYLNYLATTGFIGFSSYFLMIGSVIYLFILKFRDKDNQLLTISLFISWLTILITNFFGFSTTTINIFFYLIPGFLFMSEIEKKDVKNKTVNLFRKLLLLIPFCIATYIFVFLFNYFMGDITYSQADAYSKSDEYVQSFRLYDKALKLHKEHVYEDKLSYVLANLAVLSATDSDKSTPQKLIQASKAYNTLSLQASPQNPLYWKTQAKNYYLYYQITNNKKDLQSGLDALDIVEKLSPTDPRVDYTKTVLYDLLDNENQALSSINHTIELKADYRDAYILKAQLLRKYGKKDEKR